MKTFLLSWLLLLSAAAVAPAFAQNAVAGSEYRIETITVQGVEREAARNIVTGETRLSEGSTYDEAALEQAVYRVKRLPFVLDAAYELREGSAPGAYELVVTVETYSPVTLEVEALGAVASGDSDVFTIGELNARGFVGGQGLAFGSVRKFEGGDPSAALGYTQYGLFGRGSSATVTVSRLFPEADDFEATDAGLSVRVPVSPNNTIRAAYDWSRAEFSFFDSDFRSTTQGATLEWIYDTTDDPILALRGTQVTGSGTFLRAKGEVGGLETGENDSLNLAALGRHFVPLTSRQSLGFTLGVSYDEVLDIESLPSTYLYTAGIGHFANLWSSRTPGRRGDLRWENQVEYIRQEQSFQVFGPGDEGSARISSGLVFRNRWGIVRASLSYIEDL
ncbi:MAG TPA: BamA/TamA family outer membrane protein [Thermoanaerobaculia bacterium]|nr:BamA/TamA family outer membrane protein [Thermoanaerobaculia bacterium]